MPTLTTKIAAFEYTTFRLLDWFDEKRPMLENDFSPLKVMKLLFFVSAVDTRRTGTNYLITQVFDNFHAMPYGHVESDIYDFLKRENGDLPHLHFAKSKIDIWKDKSEFDVSQEIKDEIDKSVKSLKGKNRNLVFYDAFDLVELSHDWYSWRKTFDEARSVGLYGKKIPLEYILMEDKVFS